MIECPNIVFVDGKPVLLYCPQGLDKAELDYNNIYPNTYKIFQDFDTEKPALVDGTPIINLDYGFEAYATQGFNTPDGRALIVSWIGLPDVDYPTDKYDYQGAMSLVKELSIKDGKLYQYPVEAITSLRASQEISLKKRQQLTLTSLNLTLKLTLKQNLSSSQTKKEMACHLRLILKMEKLSLAVLRLVNSMRLTLAQAVNALLRPVKLQQQTSL